MKSFSFILSQVSRIVAGAESLHDSSNLFAGFAGCYNHVKLSMAGLRSNNEISNMIVELVPVFMVNLFFRVRQKIAPNVLLHDQSVLKHCVSDRGVWMRRLIDGDVAIICNPSPSIPCWIASGVVFNGLLPAFSALLLALILFQNCTATFETLGLIDGIHLTSVRSTLISAS